MAAVSEQLAPLPMHELWSKDFELMHHYCTVTADTLSIRREMRHVWRVVIPREGYQHPFVMHGILAIAATHKAYLVPNSRKKYLALSDYHQTVGSEGFRSTLSNVCVESQGALFCFASVVVLFMFTLPTRSATGRLENPVINLLELIGLLKGMRATQSPVLPGILKSEFAPIIYGIWPIEQTGPPAGQAEIPSASLKPYIGAIDRLEETAKLISCAGVHAEAGAVLAWMYGVDDSVLIDIGAYRPHALLTLAYYSLFLATLEKSFWYSRGWGRQLIDQIETKLAGQSKFLQLFQWPKQKLTDLYRW
ncbi:hypothetical protein AK830_g3244 [Neonectria ditissima]|uniref:Uncharacterized protein n=1 Tax=Neonectria ditissima TaxID=78410 RepID=A0A0P7BCI3_9HYPO|nr:hypothetical protein AK830_g3244 [Neonectria ditissima]